MPKSFIVIIILFFTFNVGAASESISISVGEYPPYISESLPYYGIAAQIVSEAFAKEGIEVHYVFVPWNRALRMTENNDTDASLLWVITEEREKIYLFSDIVITGKAVFFYQKNFAFDWTDYYDLEGLRFGGLSSASYPWLDECRSLGINLSIDLVQSDKQNFGKLLLGRIDLFSLDLLVGSYLLLHEFTSEERNNTTYHKKVIEEWDYRLLFSRHINTNRNIELISKFNSGIAELIDSGRYDEIINNYLFE